MAKAKSGDFTSYTFRVNHRALPKVWRDLELAEFLRRVTEVDAFGIIANRIWWFRFTRLHHGPLGSIFHLGY